MARPHCLLPTSVLVLGFCLAPCARGQFTLSTGADYSSGKYGEDEVTTVFSIPLNLEYGHGRWTFKLSAPYVHLSGPGTVLPGIGRVKKGTLPPHHDVSGIGDTTLSASYIFYQRGDGLITMDAGAEVKFGTADHTKGLGTGKEDYSGHGDIYRTWGKHTALLTYGYHVLGDPAESDLKNNFYGTTGWSFQATPATSCGLLYSANQKTSASSAAQAEAIAFATHKFGDHWNTQLYLLAGTTKASPDFGSGFVISRPF